MMSFEVNEPGSEREQTDESLRLERQKADDALGEELADHVALLSREREATDTDLASKRARSDRSVATRDEFMSVASHDLRNMLNAILGNAALIAAEKNERQA